MYKLIKDLGDVPVQYVGVRTFNWDPACGHPEAGFVEHELSEEETNTIELIRFSMARFDTNNRIKDDSSVGWLNQRMADDIVHSIRHDAVDQVKYLLDVIDRMLGE